MSALVDRLNAIKTALATAFPAPAVVTRSYKHFADRAKSELEAGVYTLFSRSLDGFSAPTAEATQEAAQQIHLLYQFQLGEKATGEEIEDQELNQFELIRDALNTQGLCPLTIENVQQSAQQDAPYGWILITLKWEE